MPSTTKDKSDNDPVPPFKDSSASDLKACGPSADRPVREPYRPENASGHSAQAGGVDAYHAVCPV